MKRLITEFMKLFRKILYYTNPRHIQEALYKSRKKRIIPGLVLSALILFLPLSCKKDIYTIQDPVTAKLVLKLDYEISVNDISKRLKSDNSAEDFKVEIFKQDGSLVYAYENYAAMPDTLELAEGSYYIEASYGENLPAAFESPWYFGVTDVFEMAAGSEKSLSLTCSLANTLVSVEYSNDVLENFDDYYTIIYNNPDSLIFEKDESRPGYFIPAPLQIRAYLIKANPEGTGIIKTLEGNIPAPLANRHYEVLINSSDNRGSFLFQLSMDDTEIETETIELNDNPPPLPDGAIAWGDLLITEIMPNPDAVSDTDGEWLEIYNNSAEIIDLQNLILTRNGSDRHVFEESLQIAPGEYLVLARSVDACDCSNLHIYGSDILLPNTGAELSIHNAGLGEEPGPAIFSLNYGESGFPSGTGVSLSLNPSALNSTEATLGASWCLSVSTFNTGDKGTPGLNNDSCN